MPKVTCIRATVAELERFEGRSAQTRPDELTKAFTRADQLGVAGLFVTSFSGESEWERHPAGDELVQVVEGETELIVAGPPAVRISLKAGSFTVVPRGAWHRFRAPRGVSILTATPEPTDHYRGPGEPPA